MNIVKEKEIVNLNKDYSILYTSNIFNIKENILDVSSNVSIIYFNENVRSDDKILEILENKFIDQVYIISKKYNKINNSKIKYCSKIKPNILILINLNNNYEYLKYVIKNLIKLFELCNQYNKSLGYDYSDTKILSWVMNNTKNIDSEDTVYLNDIINSFKANLFSTKREKYEFIYDTVCEFLDNNFASKNYCDFKNDKCIANRENCTAHKNMGCCYSFEYSNMFDPNLIKNVQLCQYMENGRCTTKNLTCKMFTCKYLKKKNIKFDSHKILLLDCFFNNKQHEIINFNFFVTREEMIDKLLEENDDIYITYFLLGKYMIKR